MTDDTGSLGASAGQGGTVHLRNGRAQRHPLTYGDGTTWCGKKLLGKPESVTGGVEAFSSYGSLVSATFDPRQATCERCVTVFNAAYKSAFPDGPRPIATFRADNPADLERARTLLSPEALRGYFGPDGGGVAVLEAAFRDGIAQPTSETPHDS